MRRRHALRYSSEQCELNPNDDARRRLHSSANRVTDKYLPISGVTRESWADRPGWDPPGGDTRMFLILKNVAEFRKNSGQTRSDSQKGHYFADSDEQRWLKKVVSFFQLKIGVTPSVATPGDTNPSDATALQHSFVIGLLWAQRPVHGRLHSFIAH